MVHYKSCEPLYAFLDVSNLPRMEWSYNLEWQMVELMFDDIKDETKSQVFALLSFASKPQVSAMGHGYACMHIFLKIE
jgi:hypothetical protein